MSLYFQLLCNQIHVYSMDMLRGSVMF